jgi:hypothetical protein
MKPIAALLLLPCLACGCTESTEARTGVSTPATAPKAPAAETKKAQLGKNVFVETENGKAKRVLVETTVCLRSGGLEQLLTRKRTKEHEAILVGDLDAKSIHAGLLLCGAEPGSPVKFLPKFEVPKGPVIKVFVEYKDGDKTIRRPAQEWIRVFKTKKDMPYDWVFVGSRIFQDPIDPKAPPYYMANDGDIIAVSNFDTACLDLPIDSSADNVNLSFEAHTERIPPLDTPVTLILEPAGAKK